MQKRLVVLFSLVGIVDSEIADCGRSLILEQVTNGLAVRMAVLYLLNGGKGPQEIVGH